MISWGRRIGLWATKRVLHEGYIDKEEEGKEESSRSGQKMQELSGCEEGAKVEIL